MKDVPALSWPQAATSPELRDRVTNARVLAVGAGGIGCELLKTLVMSGFKHIEVIDLDTIEISNLNRQFLFRKCHVGQSKAAVAAEAVKAMRADLDITAHQGNVKDSAYGLDFFRRFDLVLSGLDNLEARRHVNRLCLAAGVPLVESGTAGYLGQVSVHVKGGTECFECAAKPAPKSYPVCTIRNTPDKPIHCVVWAKDMLFTRLFGQPEATDLDEGPSGDAAGGDDGSTAGAPAEKEDPSFYERREGESSADYAARVFRRIYGSDIQRLLSVEELWRTRRQPTPLDLDQIFKGAEAGGDGVAGATNGHVGENGSAAAASACRALGLSNAHAVWDLAQNARVFLEAIRLFHDSRGDELGSAQFDKDDDLAVEFVAAAANLRALCYGIPPLSLFDAKGMAGNIIHAIATTNAIVSGLIVVEALKLLAGALGACRTTFLLQQASNKRLLTPMESPAPAPGCMVCGTAQAQLAINTKAATLQHLVDKVLKARLSLVEPTLRCGGFMYEEGEGLDPDEVEQNAAMLPRPLCALPGGGLGSGSILEVTDQRQHFLAQLVIEHREDFGSEEDNPDRFILLGSLPPAEQEAALAGGGGREGGAVAGQAAGPLVAGADEAGGAKVAAAGAGSKAGVKMHEDEDGALVLEDSEDERERGPARGKASSGAAKRKAERGGEEGTEGQGAKRARREEAQAAAVADVEEEEVIELLDDD